MKQALNERSELECELYAGLEALDSSSRFSGEQLEVIYALAYAHIAQAQYGHALPIFAFLAQYGPTKQRYVYGLGLCLQMQGRLEEAINIYSLCATLFPGCIEATQRIAQCQVTAGDHEAARMTLSMLLRYARAAGEDDLIKRTQAMLGMLKSDVSS